MIYHYNKGLVRDKAHKKLTDKYTVMNVCMKTLAYKHSHIDMCKYILQ